MAAGASGRQNSSQTGKGNAHVLGRNGHLLSIPQSPPHAPPPGRKRILIIKCSNYHIGYVLVILTNKVSIQSGGHETPSSPYLLTYMSGWNRTILPPLQNPYQAQWEAQAYHRPVVSGKPITASRQSPGFLRTCPCHVASAVNAAGFQAVTTA